MAAQQDNTEEMQPDKAKQMAMEDQASDPSEGFREQLSQEDGAMPMDDTADADELAESPIDSDLDYDTAAPEVRDIDYPSM